MSQDTVDRLACGAALILALIGQNLAGIVLLAGLTAAVWVEGDT